MPVLVTGAESSVGRATVRGLLGSGGEVRVYLDAERSDDEDAQAHRRLGCKAALGALDDEAHLETALEQAHTLVHLAGDPLADPGAQLDMLACVTSAAIGAGCRRVLILSEVALADGPAANPYLQALADGEDLLADLPMETVILRCALRYGTDDGLTEALRAGGLSGTGAAAEARHAPVAIDDVAAAVVTADRQRGSGPEVHLRVELVGPTEVTLGQFVGLLGGPPLDGPTASPLPTWVADWLSRDALGGPDALGRHGTPLPEGVRRLA